MDFPASTCPRGCALKRKRHIIEKAGSSCATCPIAVCSITNLHANKVIGERAQVVVSKKPSHLLAEVGEQCTIERALGSWWRTTRTKSNFALKAPERQRGAMPRLAAGATKCCCLPGCSVGPSHPGIPGDDLGTICAFAGCCVERELKAWVQLRLMAVQTACAAGSLPHEVRCMCGRPCVTLCNSSQSFPQ
jgi:hypothetical protein